MKAQEPKLTLMDKLANQLYKFGRLASFLVMLYGLILSATELYYGVPFLVAYKWFVLTILGLVVNYYLNKV